LAETGARRGGRRRRTVAAPLAVEEAGEGRRSRPPPLGGCEGGAVGLAAMERDGLAAMDPRREKERARSGGERCARRASSARCGGCCCSGERSARFAGSTPWPPPCELAADWPPRAAPSAARLPRRLGGVGLLPLLLS